MANSFTTSIVLTDSTGASVTGTLTLNLNPAPLAITTTTLPDATVGVPYNATLAASGGTPPYTWSGTGFPAGLTVNADGTITGTPT